MLQIGWQSVPSMDWPPADWFVKADAEVKFRHVTTPAPRKGNGFFAYCHTFGDDNNAPAGLWKR